MTDQPLQPFTSPLTLFDTMGRLFHLPALGIGFSAAAWSVMGVVGSLWALYTLVAVYHWVKYSHGSWVGWPAIAVHLGVSFLLFVYALTGVVAL